MSKKLFMTQEDYLRLENYRFQLDIVNLKIKDQENEYRIRTLSKRIHDLEGSLIKKKVNEICGTQKNKKEKLDQLRKEIAEKLGLDSLDKYVINDETLEMIHEDNIGEV